LPGDCNGDDVINIIDVTIVNKAYNSKPGEPNWDPHADINGDVGVNIEDLAKVNKNYGYGQ